ncbi:MAG: helix-turn-helix domain-containing protein [Thermoanaerobaculia bacterium]
MPDQTTQPQEPRYELASFGDELRREREIRGISLKEIADATKISKRFLEAIEKNDHKTLPAPVFTRGFVREYARYLGLSADEMVNRYNHAAAGDDRIEQTLDLQRFAHPDAMQPPLPELPRKTPTKRGLPSPVGIDRSVLLLVLLAAALAAVAWWAVQNRHRWDSDARDSRETPVTPLVTTSAPPAAPPAARTQNSVPGEKLRLVLSVADDAWVTLEADGTTILNDELKAGDRRTFEANDEFRFRTIGNAAGVTLTLNDLPIPSLGGDGEVIRNRTFDRARLQELRGEGSQTDQ